VQPEKRRREQTAKERKARALPRQRLRRRRLPLFTVLRILSRGQPEQKPSRDEEQLPGKPREEPDLLLPEQEQLSLRLLRARDCQSLSQPPEQPEPRIPRERDWRLV
jgi:hypothetical protein